MIESAVLALIFLWMLIPVVFLVGLWWENHKSREADKKRGVRRVKFTCACGKPDHAPEFPYEHGPKGCGPSREMIP